MVDRRGLANLVSDAVEDLLKEFSFLESERALTTKAVVASQERLLEVLKIDISEISREASRLARSLGETPRTILALTHLAAEEIERLRAEQVDLDGATWTRFCRLLDLPTSHSILEAAEKVEALIKSRDAAVTESQKLRAELARTKETLAWAETQVRNFRREREQKAD